MDDQQKDVLDALEGLVLSDGWGQLRDYVQREWGNDGFAQKVERIVAVDAAGVQVRLAELLAERLAVRTLMAWPHQRIAELKQQREGAVVPRGAGRM